MTQIGNFGIRLCVSVRAIKLRVAHQLLDGRLTEFKASLQSILQLFARSGVTENSLPRKLNHVEYDYQFSTCELTDGAYGRPGRTSHRSVVLQKRQEYRTGWASNMEQLSQRIYSPTFSSGFSPAMTPIRDQAH